MPGRRTKQDHPATFNPHKMRESLEEKGWNAAYLRRMLQLWNVNPKVDQILNGHRAPSGPTSALIAHLLGLSLDDLYTIDEGISVKDATRQLGKPRLRRGRPKLHEQGVPPGTPTSTTPSPEPKNVVD
jgi:hypothetical protein